MGAIFNLENFQIVCKTWIKATHFYKIIIYSLLLIPVDPVHLLFELEFCGTGVHSLQAGLGWL